MNELLQEILNQNAIKTETITTYFFESKTKKDKKLSKDGWNTSAVDRFLVYAHTLGHEAEPVEWSVSGILVKIRERSLVQAR